MKKDARNFMLTMISIPAILAGAAGVHALSPAVEEPIADVPIEVGTAPVVSAPTPAPAAKAAPAKKPLATPKPVPTPVPVAVPPTPVVQPPAPTPVVVIKKTPTTRVRTTRAS